MENPSPENNSSFYYHMYQHAPVGAFVYDSQPMLIFANPKVYQMLGISPKNIPLALKNGFENDRLNECIRAVLKGEFRTFEGTLSSLYGTEDPYVKIEFQRIEIESEKKVYCLGIIQNMTDQRQLFKELAESRDILQNFIETLQIGFVIIVTFNDQFIYVSPAVSDLTGILIDKYDSVSDIMAAANNILDMNVVHQAYADFKIGKQIDVEFRVSRADNSVRWIHAKTFPEMNPSGVSFRVTALLEDVTQKKNIQDMLLQSQKLESIGRLAAGISHDFNNIIASIFANAELGLIDLEEDLLTPERAKEYFDGIINLGQRAKELTNKLLYFSQQGRYNLQSVNLNDIVKEIVKLFSKEVGSKSGIQFETDLQSNIPVYVQINQIQQLIQNLLSNAREAMERGGKIIVRTYDSYISPKIINTFN